MDQATELRKMMNGKQQNSVYSVAFLSMSDILNVDKLLKEMVSFYSKNENERTALLGVQDKKAENQLNEYLLSEKKLKQNAKEDYLLVSGRFDCFNEIRKKTILQNRFLNLIERVEKENETLFYYVGNEINSISVNLSLLASTIVLIVKDRHESMIQALRFMEILSQIDETKKVMVIFDTENENIFQEQSKKLQELSLRKFNYHIEPIGFAAMKYVPVRNKTDLMKQFDLTLIKKHEKKERLSELFLGYM